MIQVIRERDVEKYFVKRVQDYGGVAEKFKSPGKPSVPDRLVSWPGGWVEFVELKAPGKKATPAQKRDHARRRRMAFTVSVLDSIESVDYWIKFLRLDVAVC